MGLDFSKRFDRRRRISVALAGRAALESRWQVFKRSASFPHRLSLACGCANDPATGAQIEQVPSARALTV